MKKKIIGLSLVLVALVALADKIILYTDKPNAIPVGSDFMSFQRNADFISASVSQVKGDWFNNPVFSGNGGIQGIWTAVTFIGDGSQLTGIKTTATNGPFVFNFGGFGTNETFYGPTSFLGTNQYGKLEIFDAGGNYIAGFDTNHGGFWGFYNLNGGTNLQPSILTVTADANDPNTRRLAAGANVTLTDGGAGSTLTVAVSGAPPTGTAGGDLTGTYPNPTLPTVNANVGTFGDGTHVFQGTVNAKGQVTAAANVTITGAAPTGSAGGVLSGTYPNPGFANPDTFPGPVTVPSLTNTGNMLMKGTETNSSMGLGVVHSDSFGGRSSSSVANSDLANSSVTINGTANQITGGGSVSLGGTLTLATPQNIDTAANVTFGSVKTSGKVQSTGNAEVNALILTNETVLVSTAWANSPSGAYDMSISAQTYTITAASAITSFINTRLGTLQNYSEFAVTNSGGSDLALTISASGYTENDGLRSFTITNKSQRIIRFKSSAMGVNGISQPFF